MSIPRRDFLKGALAAFGLGAFGGGRLFAAPPGWKPAGKKPNLVFGVLADTHLRTARDGRSVDRNYTDRYFVAALKYFRLRNVDAVMHLGDLANNGQVEAMQFHADAWRSVFPGDKGGDGRKVERLFVTGNHDVEGFTYTKFMEQLIGDAEERRRHLLADDMAGHWERIWGEPYEEAWHKTVKGYHFFGQHYPSGEFDAAQTAAVVNACRAADATLDDGVRPVFLLTHRKPHLTAMERAAGPLANAFGFHGHWHQSATNWNVIGLEKNRFPYVQCPACHSARGEAFVGKGESISKVPVQGGGGQEWKSRQGYVVNVYDDLLVIERHEFDAGVASLGPDWVMSFGRGTGNGERGTGSGHSFSREELKKAIGEPQFRKGAKLEVGWRAQETKATKGTEGTASDGNVASVPSVVSVPSLRLSIPLADGNPDSRVYAYEVVVVGEAVGRDDPIAPQTGESGGMGSCRPTKLLKAVYAAGCNMGLGREPNGGVTTLEIPQSELPSGKKLTVAVRPLSSLGTFGHAIAKEVAVWKKKPRKITR